MLLQHLGDSSHIEVRYCKNLNPCSFMGTDGFENEEKNQGFLLLLGIIFFCFLKKIKNIIYQINVLCNNEESHIFNKTNEMIFIFFIFLFKLETSNKKYFIIQYID